MSILSFPNFLLSLSRIFPPVPPFPSFTFSYIYSSVTKELPDLISPSTPAADPSVFRTCQKLSFNLFYITLYLLFCRSSILYFHLFDHFLMSLCYQVSFFWSQLSVTLDRFHFAIPFYFLIHSRLLAVASFPSLCFDTFFCLCSQLSIILPSLPFVISLNLHRLVLVFSVVVASLHPLCCSYPSRLCF